MGVPDGAYRSSGDLVRLPTNVTRLKLAMWPFLPLALAYFGEWSFLRFFLFRLHTHRFTPLALLNMRAHARRTDVYPAPTDRQAIIDRRNVFPLADLTGHKKP